MIIKIVLYDDEMEIKTNGLTDYIVEDIVNTLDKYNVHYNKGSYTIKVFNPPYILLFSLSIDNDLIIM